MSFGSRSTFPLAACAAALLLGACPAPRSDRVDTAERDTLRGTLTKIAERDTTAHQQQLGAADTATIARSTDTSITNARPSTPRVTSLDPLADSISDRMVFLATTQTTFIAASRGKRLLLDLGRFDGKIANAKQKKAFEQAAGVLSPVRIGDTFAMRGPWGADTMAVNGYALWNGRIVATLAVSRTVDSLAKSGATLVALAKRIVPDTTHADSLAALPDSTVRPTPPVPPPPATPPPAPVPLTPADSAAQAALAAQLSCHVDTLGEALKLRVAELADSLTAVLEADTVKLTDRLKKSVKTAQSTAVGCFGHWHVLLLVSQSAGDYEYVRQIGLVVDTLGIAMPLSIRDLRFKAHDVVRVFDADGDGVDDIAVRGHGHRIGGLVILRFLPDKKRLEYVITGFAWEEL